MLKRDDPREAEIWLVDFEPQSGHEQAGVRPALVVSNDLYNEAPNNFFIVCPMTSRDRGLRYHIRVEPIDGVLSQTSFVMCEQEKAQDRTRFLKKRGMAPEGVLGAARKIIGEFF